ncbi:MAG: exonuclease SbcCD subunit D, partial [Bdellovibrionota bacterium]
EIIDAVKPDALLIAGDVFDRPLPPEAAVRLFDDFLSRVVMERSRPVFLIPGNHDSAERLGFASRLLRERGLTIFSKPEDALKPVKLKCDDGTEAMIFGIPFVEPVQIGRLLGREDIRTFDQATRALSAEMLKHSIAGMPSVLLCHAFVVGGEASDSERDLYVGGSSNVDISAFDGFAYTALGHLHKPQRAGSERVRYSGSLYTYSKSEIGHAKGVSEIRLSPDGTSEVVEHAIEPARRLTYVEGTLESLVAAAAQAERRDDYVLAGLTDPGPVVDALARLRSVYPNLLHVSRVQSAFLPTEIPTAARLNEREAISELDLFAAFVQETTGAELSADEREFVLESIRDLDRPLPAEETVTV